MAKALKPQTPLLSLNTILVHKELVWKMSSSWNLEDMDEQAYKEKDELEARYKYLQAKVA